MKQSTDTAKFMSHFAGHTIYVSMGEYNDAPMHYHSGYKVSEVTLRGRNDKEGEWQHGIFFTVNELDEKKDSGRHRTKKMLKRFRCIFMDDDNVREGNLPLDGERFPLVPSLIVNSSPGKFHYYWLISDNDFKDKEEWENIQRGLIERFSGDNNAKDITRYLRLPGYFHWKDKKEPHKVSWTGEGQEYKWQEISGKFLHVEKNSAQVSSPKEEQDQDPKGIAEHEEAIISGRDYHGSILSIGYQMKQEGVQDRYITLALQGIMNQCSKEDKETPRWKSRYAEIERSVVEAIGKYDIVIPPSKESKDSKGEVPWPPGLLGDLAQDAMNMARFQYREVAIVSAIGVVAGICGRKFNCEGGGLNVYITLIMETGMGKDSINNFITSALSSSDDMGRGMDFLGPTRFTGPKAVYSSLKSNRSIICVFTEAGLLLNSKAGDGDGLKRILLGLYTKSGRNSWSGREVYSDEDKSIQSLRAPSLSIINESTPDMLLDVFKRQDGLTTGDVPRQLIFRIIGDKPESNRDAYKHRVSVKCNDKIKRLIGKCAGYQDKEDPESWDMIPDQDVGDAMQEEEHRYVVMQNRCRREGEANRYAMSTRAYYKAVRLASICSVFNHSDAKIRMEEWIWGRDMVRYEMEKLEIFFEGSGVGEDSLEDMAIRVVGIAIIKILNGRYENKDIADKMPSKELKKGKFTLYQLTRALRRNKEIIKMGDNTASFSPRGGVEKMLEYMIRQGLIEKSSSNLLAGSTKVFKITASFSASYR